MSDPLFLLRYLDLVVLAVALPVFLVAGWPVAGWGAAAFAWIAWRLIARWTDRKAEATDDLKKMAGIMTGSMIARGWLVALTILAVGLLVSDEAGLSAGVLLFAVFTVSFTASFVTRPFDNHQPST